MNKRKRVARDKHRTARKKLEEKRRREKALPGHQPSPAPHSASPPAGRTGAARRGEHAP
jgi:hypothetical protein